MSNANFGKLGDWNVICDVCESKFKASKCRMRWDNKFVCPQCFEERHPQEFLVTPIDKQTVPISRPRRQVVFVT